MVLASPGYTGFLEQSASCYSHQPVVLLGLLLLLIFTVVLDCSLYFYVTFPLGRTPQHSALVVFPPAVPGPRRSFFLVAA